MKRILSLVLTLVMVFGAIMPAFAEGTSTTKTSGEMLEEYGLIAGTGNGLEEDRPLKRSEMAVILAKLNNKANIAQAYAFPSSFTDVPATAWYAKWVAYAEVQNWMVGDATGGTFRPETYLSAQEVNILMVKALGYTDTKWEDANAKAVELKIAVNSKNANLVLRGDIFKAMTDTLDVPKKGEVDVLGTTLALKGYAPPTPDVPATLEISDIMSDNLKTIAVEFNQEINKKTVNTTNFKVTGLTVSEVKLSDDKKSVTMIMSSAIAQSKEIEIVIKKVKSIDDSLTIADYKEKQVVVDVTIPVIESVTVVDAKHVKVQASEPMDWNADYFTVLAGVKLDDKYLVGRVEADHQNYTYTIEFNSVKKEGSYTLNIEGVKDFAGLGAIKKDFSFDVTKDDSAPVALSVTSTNIDSVEVTFDEPLATIGTITINGKDTNVSFKDGSGKKVVIATFSNSEDKLNLGATVEVVVKYKGQKDVVGNEVKTDTTISFKVEDDTALPTANIEVEKANKITFTFSKSMDISLGKIIVMDTSNKVKKTVNVSSLTSKWTESNTILTLVGSDLGFNNIDPLDRIIQLKDMKDNTVRANLLATTDYSIAVLDTKTPVVSKAYTVSAGDKTSGTDYEKDDTITFYFSEALDEETVKNLSNFKRNTEAGTFATVPGVSFKSIATDGRSAVFIYPNSVNFSDAFTVFALKDLAGNMVGTETAIVKNNMRLISVPSVVAKKDTEIEVTYPVDIATADPSSIRIDDNSGAYTAATQTSIEGRVVTYTLNKALPTDTTNITVELNNSDLLISVFGDKYSAAWTENIVKVEDAIAPTITSIDDGQWDGSKIDLVKNYAVLTLSEEMDVIGVNYKNDIVIRLNDKMLDSSDYDMTLSTDKKHINIEVKSNSKVTADDNYAFSVAIVRQGNFKDEAIGTKVNLAPVTKSITNFDYDYTAFTPTMVVTYEATDGLIDKIIVTANGNITEAIEGDFILAGETAGDDLSITGLNVASNVATLTVNGIADVTVTDDTMAWAADAFKVNGIAVAARTAAVMTDKALPKVMTIAVATPIAPFNEAKLGENIIYTLVFTEKVDAAVVSASVINDVDTSLTVTTDLDANDAVSDTIEFAISSGDTGTAALNNLNFTITDSNSNVTTYGTHGVVTAAATGGLTGTVTIDGIAPTVNVTAVETLVKNGVSVEFTAEFSEAVIGTPQIALSAGETLAAVNMLGGATTWTYTHVIASGLSATIQAQITVATDAYGNAVTGNFVAATNTTVVTDNIVPTLDTVTTTDTDNDGKIEYMLTFSEAILDSSVDVANFGLVGGTAVAGTANDATYVIESNLVDTDAMAITYTKGSLTDLVGNTLEDVTLADVTDTVAPIADSAAYDNGILLTETDDKITITFSEPLTANALIKGDIAVTFDNATTPYTTADITLDNTADFDIALVTGELVITLTKAGQDKIENIGTFDNGSVRVVIDITTRNATPALNAAVSARTVEFDLTNAVIVQVD